VRRHEPFPVPSATGPQRTSLAARAPNLSARVARVRVLVDSPARRTTARPLLLPETKLDGSGNHLCQATHAATQVRGVATTDPATLSIRPPTQLPESGGVATKVATRLVRRTHHGRAFLGSRGRRGARSSLSRRGLMTAATTVTPSIASVSMPGVTTSQVCSIGFATSCARGSGTRTGDASAGETSGRRAGGVEVARTSIVTRPASGVTWRAGTSGAAGRRSATSCASPARRRPRGIRSGPRVRAAARRDRPRGRSS
jgi:hypothetical protein